MVIFEWRIENEELKMKHINKKLDYLTVLFAMVQVFFACSEEERITYYDAKAPAPMSLDLSSVSVKNLPGKAVIKFQSPVDDNLLYVKAVYESAPGVVRETKASLYVDTLQLEGFNAAGDYRAKLYCVGKNEKESAPVEVTVSPLTPPYIEAFPSLTMQNAFGGVRGSFQNLHESELKVTLMVDSLGEGRYELLRSYVTNLRDAKFNYLGLPPKESSFAAYLQDRWGNRSDTAYFSLTPLFEDKIDKSTWSWYGESMPSDSHDWPEKAANNLYMPSRMWDDENPAEWRGSLMDGILPFTVTVKLGIRVTLSRIVVYHCHLWGGGYTGNAPKRFEIWGSDKDKPGDDLLGGDWTMLGNFTSVLPSGRSEATEADKQAGIYDGDTFFFEPTDEIPNPYQPTKFIRFRHLETWNGDSNGINGRVMIGEIDLYGQYEK